MIRLYKEGQGIWSRGLLATVIGGTGLLASVRTYQFLVENEMLESQLLGLGLRTIVAIGLMIPFFVLGAWLYNHPKLTDFLIDTESEMKNKVTWPTRKEAFNNSVVVVVSTVILGVWILVADSVFHLVKNWVYGIGV